MNWYRHLISAGVIGAMVFGAVGLQPAVEARPGESHCVVAVVDQKADGELVMGSPTCFEGLSDALNYASLSQFEAVEAHSNFGSLQPLAGSFILGTHFDGTNGTGSSISVTGSSCTGGWWNTSSVWDNRISSSYNGCYRLRHYDYPNKAGSSYDTSGVGQTDNIYGGMNNRTESVAYYSS